MYYDSHHDNLLILLEKSEHSKSCKLYHICLQGIENSFVRYQNFRNRVSCITFGYTLKTESAHFSNGIIENYR